MLKWDHCPYSVDNKFGTKNRTVDRIEKSSTFLWINSNFWKYNNRNGACISGNQGFVSSVNIDLKLKLNTNANQYVNFKDE